MPFRSDAVHGVSPQLACGRMRPVRFGSRCDGSVHVSSLPRAGDGTWQGGHSGAHAVSEAVHGLGALAGRRVHGGFSGQYNQLEADFVLEKGLAGDELLLPRHRLETFIAFLLWCSIDAGRARSMGGLWRTMGAIFGAWSLPYLT